MNTNIAQNNSPFKYAAHLAVAKNLIENYNPVAPLSAYLKSYFRQHKKHGSRDRKLITALCYNYFRLGCALQNISIEEKILTGFFLCEHAPSEFLQSLKPAWNEMIARPTKEKLIIENRQSDLDNIFTFKDALSDEIDHAAFSLSFLIQPKLFIRIRKGFKEIVLPKLQAVNIQYEVAKEDCIALPNASKVDTVIELDKEAVVQDYNSQRAGELIRLAIDSINCQQKSKINVWDCCTASGGKSIMAYDIDTTINLTVSDKRKSILQNLQERFAKAGIKNYHSFVADLSGNKTAFEPGVENKPGDKTFDLVIADVPCTGSGTWARTPEQLYYFDKKLIEKYSTLQKKIVANVIQYVKPGGYLLYITCSVFKKENEDVTEFIENGLKLNLVKRELFKGYEIQADTMFAALFILQ